MNFDPLFEVLGLQQVRRGSSIRSILDLRYDALGRLAHASQLQGAQSQDSSYRFDANGSRSEVSYSGAGMASYSVGDSSNRLQRIVAGGSARDFAHDGAGNLLRDSRGGITDCLGYDAFGRTASFLRYGGDVSCASGGAVQSSASYRHNGLNQRSFKNANGLSTRYVYAPSGELLYEIASNGSLRHYIWFAGQMVAVIWLRLEVLARLELCPRRLAS